MSYPIYLINLAKRTDRLDQSTKAALVHGFQFERIEAISSESLSQSDYEFAAPGVVATMLSHKLALKRFLETSDDFALILEDDFRFRFRFRLPSLTRLNQLDLDVLQLGYLHSSLMESVNIMLINFRALVLRCLLTFNRISVSRLANFYSKQMFREIQKCPVNFVPSDIRPGGHAYIVSRHAASVILRLNNPVFLSADELLKSISVMRTLKTARTFYTKIGQTNSKSSVTQRNV